MVGTSAFWGVMEASNTGAVTVAQTAVNQKIAPAVVPLELYASAFASMEETVSGSAEISGQNTNVRWFYGQGGKTYNISGTSLEFTDGAAVSAQLREVVYLLNFDSTVVHLVVLVFHAGQRRIGVAVSARTFEDLFAYAAHAGTVLVSTVATDHSKAPAVSGNFPNLKVAYVGTSAPSPTSSLNPNIARIAVVADAPAGSAGAKPLLMGAAIQPGNKYFGVLAPIAVAPSHVEILDQTNRQLLHSSVLETVTARAAIAMGHKGATWTGRDGEYGIDAGWLTMPARAKAPLREVIYVVSNWGSAFEWSVLLVFKSGHELVVVPIRSGAFKQHFASLAWGVSVSTVAANPQVHSSVPVLTDSGSYPKLALNFTSEQPGVPAESALAFSVPRIVGGVLHYMSAPARMFGKVVAASAASTQPATQQVPASAQDQVVPLGFITTILKSSVLETVTARAALTIGQQGATWVGTGGGNYAIRERELTLPSREKATLSEVIYVIGKAAPSSVVAVLLVFNKSGMGPIVVNVERETFKRHFSDLPNQVTLVSTVASNETVHDSVPALTDWASYPKIALTFTSVMHAVPETSALADEFPRISGGVLYHYNPDPPAKMFGKVVRPSAASTQSAATSASGSTALDRAQSLTNALLISTKQQMMSAIQKFATSATSATPETVEPLDAAESALLVMSVLKPVTTSAVLTTSASSVEWNGGAYKIDGAGLTAPQKQPAPLSEVIYAVGASGVACILVFKGDAFYAVKVKPVTFGRLRSYALKQGVIVSTVATTAEVHDAVPVIPLTEQQPLYGLSVRFDSAMAGVPPGSVLAVSRPRIVKESVTGPVLRFWTGGSAKIPKKMFGVEIIVGAPDGTGPLPNVKAGPDQRVITVAGLRDAALNGRYEAAVRPTDPLEWRLRPDPGNQATIVVASQGVLALKAVKSGAKDGAKESMLSMWVAEGTPQIVHISDKEAEPSATATFGPNECEGYWETWDTCGEACGAIAECAASAETSQVTARLIYEGATVTLRALTGLGEGPAGPAAPTGQTAATGSAAPIAMYGTLEGVHYVLKGSGDTAKVIRKSGQTVDVLDASRKDGDWKVSSAAVVPVIPVAAECADLRACLKSTPLEACATKTCKPTSLASSGEKLEHGGKNVELYALDDARVGSDERGMFVVAKDGKKGKMLFVEAGATTGATVDVALDEGTWRASPAAPAGPNWTLIIGIVGGVVGLLILIAVLVFAFTRKSGPAAPVGAYGPAAPGAAIGAIAPAGPAGPP
jgi:hypothetical protein